MGRSAHLRVVSTSRDELLMHLTLQVRGLRECGPVFLSSSWPASGMALSSVPLGEITSSQGQLLALPFGDKLTR